MLIRVYGYGLFVHVILFILVHVKQPRGWIKGGSMSRDSAVLLHFKTLLHTLRRLLVSSSVTKASAGMSDTSGFSDRTNVKSGRSYKSR